ALMLMLMRFPEELVDESEYDFPAHTGSKSKELDMAVQLVESLKGPFDPSKYKDEYDANLRKIINARAKGRHATIKAAAGEKHDPKVLELMSKLQKSLGGAKRKTHARKRKSA